MERLRQFEGFSKRTPGYVPSEALVYFLRKVWAEGAQVEFKKIFRVLLRRVDQSLGSVISDSRISGARGIREEISGRFGERIAKDCKGRSGLLDFYEIRFDKALATFRVSALREIRPSALDTVPLSANEDDGLEISPEVDAAAAEFLGGDQQKLDDPAFRLALTRAIDSLPDHCLDRDGREIGRVAPLPRSDFASMPMRALTAARRYVYISRL